MPYLCDKLDMRHCLNKSNNARCMVFYCMLVEQNNSMWLMTMLKDLLPELLNARYNTVICAIRTQLVTGHADDIDGTRSI